MALFSNLGKASSEVAETYFALILYLHFFVTDLCFAFYMLIKLSNQEKKCLFFPVLFFTTYLNSFVSQSGLTSAEVA